MLYAFAFCRAETKTLEILLLILNSILFVLLFLCLIIIKFKNLVILCKFLIPILFVIVCANLTISSLLTHWRRKNVIKGEKKTIAARLGIVGLVLDIILFILSLINIIGFARSIANNETSNCDYNFNYYGNCKYNNNIKIGEIIIGYITYSFSDFSSLIGFCIWLIERSRLEQGLDMPFNAQNNNQNLGQIVYVQQPGGQGILVNNYQNQYSYPVNYVNNNQANNPVNNPANTQSNNLELNDPHQINSDAADNQVLELNNN